MARAVYGTRRIGKGRKGTCSLWLKRNWLLMIMVLMAIAGVVLSILLFLEPCDKKTKYDTTNVTSIQNVTTVVNVTTVENVTSYFNETHAYNVTSYFNETHAYNVTTEVMVEVEVSQQQAVDVVVALDSSNSVSADGWTDENAAARTLLRGLRNDLESDMAAGLSVWANDGVVRMELAAVADADAVDAYDADRVPYCSAVPASGSQNQAQCVDTFGYAPSGTWAMTGVYTYYSQALLSCIDELAARGRNDSFQLCIIITDGVISEDSYAQDPDWTTMLFTDTMVENFYDAGSAYELYFTSGEYYGYYVTEMWIAPGAYAFCQSAGISVCSVDNIARYMKDDLGITIQNVLVGSEDIFTANVTSRMSQLSSCDSSAVDYDGCAYLSKSDDFEALNDAATTIAASVATQVGTVMTLEERTTTETETRTSSSTVAETETRTSSSTVAETTTTPVTTTASVTDMISLTESLTTQETVCTGDGVSFAFMLLAIPLLVYLFFKPISNVLERCLCPPDAPPPAPEAAQSPCTMSVNPVFGKEIDPDADQQAPPQLAKKERAKIDNTLTKQARGKKKKKIFGLVTPRGGGGAARRRRRRRAQRTTTSSRRPPPPPRFTPGRGGSATEWGTGIAAVYDGDDWQETVADFVIAVVCCKCGAKKAADSCKDDPHPL
ncbi:hypothetical protein JL720_6044 [Aureococcus anophagefferens]|nr:hypothetical protein JL720_6044 [Aureococcus anophagefferens]